MNSTFDYIPISLGCPSNEKVVAFAEKIGVSRVAHALGHWTAFLAWAARDAQDGDVTHVTRDTNVTRSVAARALDCDEGSAGEMIRAMLDVGLLERSGENGDRVIIHHWFEHGPGAYLVEKQEQRRAARDRKRKEREKKQAEDVTDKSRVTSRGQSRDVTPLITNDKSLIKEHPLPPLATDAVDEAESPPPRTGRVLPLGSKADPGGKPKPVPKPDPPPKADLRKPPDIPDELPTPEQVIADDAAWSVDVKAAVLVEAYVRLIGKRDGKADAIVSARKRLAGKALNGDAQKHRAYTFAELHKALRNYHTDFKLECVRRGKDEALAYAVQANNLFGRAFRIGEWFGGPKLDAAKVMAAARGDTEKSRRQVAGAIGGQFMRHHKQVIADVGMDLSRATDAGYFAGLGFDEAAVEAAVDFPWREYRGSGYRSEGAFKDDVWEFLKARLAPAAKEAADG